ncbi:MAG: outer membrane beta-barrel protein [Fulvivirga sp.]|uniref:outer membrane beta-barrel protein n=1 Tax=Fulvivirga sp. TaxID=1931237 RepID=UPI0032F02A12
MQKVNKAFYVLLIIVSVTFCAFETKAQTACTQTLRQARTVFDEGRIHELEQLLSDCIDNGFTDDERTEAYRLLILAHIYLDETVKADDAMLELLRDNHGFEINQQADPAELINLYNTFRHDPIFFWGFRGGFNTSFVNVIEAHGVHDLNNSNASYSNQLGFVVGLLIEKRFGSRITLRSDLQYIINTFDHSFSTFRRTDTNIDIVNSTASETQNSAGMSLMAQFRLFPEKEAIRKNKFEKLNPYVGLGVTGRYILSSALTFDVSNSAGASPDGASEDLIDAEIRNQFNPTADIEFGIKKALGLMYFTAGVRYSYGFLDITDRHYDNGRLTTFFGWGANDINTHSLTAFIGILIPQYVPKKLTK